jgi:hypothetical protein
MLLCSDNTKRLLMYYNVMTMTIMVILNSCSSLKEKTIARIRAKYGQGARHARTLSATSTCSHNFWNIDMELVRTRFHCSMIFHKI